MQSISSTGGGSHFSLLVHIVHRYVYKNRLEFLSIVITNRLLLCNWRLLGEVFCFLVSKHRNYVEKFIFLPSGFIGMQVG